MGRRNERHVVPNPDGGWDVKKPRADKASSHHPTQAEAEVRAKEISAAELYRVALTAHKFFHHSALEF